MQDLKMTDQMSGHENAGPVKTKLNDLSHGIKIIGLFGCDILVAFEIVIAIEVRGQSSRSWSDQLTYTVFQKNIHSYYWL